MTHGRHDQTQGARRDRQRAVGGRRGRDRRPRGWPVRRRRPAALPAGGGQRSSVGPRAAPAEAPAEPPAGDPGRQDRPLLRRPGQGQEGRPHLHRHPDPARLQEGVAEPRDLAEVLRLSGGQGHSPVHDHPEPRARHARGAQDLGCPVRCGIGLDVPDRQSDQRREASPERRLRVRVLQRPGQPGLLDRGAALRHRTGDALGALPVAGLPARARPRDARADRRRLAAPWRSWRPPRRCRLPPPVGLRNSSTNRGNWQP